MAQPAGAAVAPVRQRGHRSLLIKVGVIAGAGNSRRCSGRIVGAKSSAAARGFARYSSVDLRP